MKEIDVESVIKDAFLLLVIFGGMATMAVCCGQVVSCEKSRDQQDTAQKVIESAKLPVCKDEVMDKRQVYRSCTPGATIEIQDDLILCHCPKKEVR